MTLNDLHVNVMSDHLRILTAAAVKSRDKAQSQRRRNVSRSPTILLESRYACSVIRYAIFRENLSTSLYFILLLRPLPLFRHSTTATLNALVEIQYLKTILMRFRDFKIIMRARLVLYNIILHYFYITLSV